MVYETPPWWKQLLYRSGAQRLGHLGWWLSLIPFWMTPSFWGSLLVLPFRWFFAAWQERRLKHLLGGLPALLILIASAYLIHRIRQQNISVSNDYWAAAEAAVIAKDYEKAEMLLDRVLQENRARVEDARYLLAVVFEETGRVDRAESLFSSLAPDDRQGFRDAHRRLSLVLSERISEQSPEADLKRLKWHLDAARDQQSARMAVAWGRYSIATRNLEEARRYLELAADEFPELWITLGEVHTRLGNSEQALASYQKATAYLSGQVSARADDSAVRVDYATVLMGTGKLDEARVILEEGLRRDPEGQWKQLLAALYVNYHDLLMIQGNHPISELLAPIEKSLENEPNFGPALNRLMGYASAKVEGNVELKKVLSRVVAEGKQPALARLALGNVCWLEGDTDGAVLNFELALENNKELAVVLNNLAWLVSHQPEKPDFERALAMANSAIAKAPDVGSYLDTRGTIYQLMGKHREALTDFEKALPTVVDKAAVHKKLAEVYTELGRTEMAEQHRVLEQEERAKATKPSPGTGANTQTP